MTTLRGRHALVTGGNRGIGAEVARQLAAQGADITLLVRTPASAAPVVAELTTLGVRARVVQADVTDRAQVAAACHEAIANAPVDILVNNAGTAETAPFLKSDAALFERMLAMHLLGPVAAAQAVLPGMVERGQGWVVNVASVAGLRGGRYIAAYVAAKHAMVGLTRALAEEFGPQGIHVNAVCPGFVDTDLVSAAVQRLVDKTGRTANAARDAILAESGQARLLTSAEVARQVVALCQPGVTASGTAEPLMGETA